MYYIFGAVALLAIWILVGLIPTLNIEKPSYEVLEDKGFYEIRRYDPYIIAYTEVESSLEKASSDGFMTVANYIFGDNTSKSKIAMTSPVVQEKSEKIAMTSPVIQEGESGNFKVQFVMPSKYSMEDLPEPNNDKVKLQEVAAKKVAVHRFSWLNSKKKLNKKQKRLLDAVREDGLEVAGEPTFAFYNPPITPPFMRRNEVWVEIK